MLEKNVVFDSNCFKGTVEQFKKRLRKTRVQDRPFFQKGGELFQN